MVAVRSSAFDMMASADTVDIVAAAPGAFDEAWIHMKNKSRLKKEEKERVNSRSRLNKS